MSGYGVFLSMGLLFLMACAGAWLGSRLSWRGMAGAIACSGVAVWGFHVIIVQRELFVISLANEMAYLMFVAMPMLVFVASLLFFAWIKAYTSH